MFQNSCDNVTLLPTAARTLLPTAARPLAAVGRRVTLSQLVSEVTIIARGIVLENSKLDYDTLYRLFCWDKTKSKHWLKFTLLFQIRCLKKDSSELSNYLDFPTPLSPIIRIFRVVSTSSSSILVKRTIQWSKWMQFPQKVFHNKFCVVDFPTSSDDVMFYFIWP